MVKITNSQLSVFTLTVLSILMVLFSGPRLAAQTITPAQLEQLRNLSDAQKQQLMRALGTDKAPVSNAPKTVPVEIFQDSPEPPTLEGFDAADRLAPNDLLMIELGSEDEDEILLSSVRQALGKNVYTLDEQGFLQIAGLKGILMAGLTVEQAQLRLESEPLLSGLQIRVHLLPVDPVGSVALKRYGADFFQASPTTFAPAGNVPVPVDYVVGTGDTISLLLYGQHNADYRLTIDRDGAINIPEVGPITIAGMRFDKIRDELGKRIQERYIGVNLYVTLGELRSIQVFVLGDVNHPGSYTVSGLSNMTNVLFVSGGVADSGTMRKIQLKRKNRVIGTLDLYDLLLNGNTGNDLRIRSGDVIYVPPVGAEVAVYGHVKRPAIYELKNERDLPVIIEMAGGLLPTADQSRITIRRFNKNNRKSLLVSDLSTTQHSQVVNGDQIEVLGSDTKRIRNRVSVKGYVNQDLELQWRPGLRLLDALPDPSVFENGTDQNYIVVRRVEESTGRISLLSSNWRNAYESRNSSDNIELQSQDTIYVFNLGDDRATKLEPLLNELRVQASEAHPAQVVAVQGRVRSPGKYPLEPGMRVSDLIRASGSVLENAYLDEVEVTRIDVSSPMATTLHVTIDLNNLVPGSVEDLELDHSDVVTVKEIPVWREYRNVTILGEIAYPGTYSVSRGERLSSVLARAGGLTSMAFPSGSIFLRADLKEREEEQLKLLERRLRTEISALGADDQIESRARGEALLSQLGSTEAIGRLVIDLNLALSGNTDHDVILEDGDKLVVPSQSQEVTVIGEVQYPTSHIYQNGLDHFSYINKSGGSTQNSDFERIYVIRADGNVVAQAGSRWFRKPGRAISINPGDTIVVPFDADRVSKLTLWSSVSGVVYNIGVAAAAIASF